MFSEKRQSAGVMIGADRNPAELRYPSRRSVAYAGRRRGHDQKPIHTDRWSRITRPARCLRRTLVRGSIGGSVVYQAPRRISTPRRPSRRWRSQKPGFRCAKEASIRPPALMLSSVLLIGRVRSFVVGTLVGANALRSIVFMIGALRFRFGTSGQDRHRGSSRRIGRHQ